MAAAIEINGLSKEYSVGFWRKRKRTALKPLNLTIEEGEIFGYLGPNGAGKTTTLKLLMGLIFATAGSARILGLDSQEPRVKAQVGYLPEQPYFYDYLTAEELLRYYAELSGMAAEERSRRVSAMLEQVGLRDCARLQLRKFSKGMLQRVGIAQAILHQPKVVFLDEPMSGLDPVGRREVRDIIDRLRQEGRTVFFSTHILSDAESLCDRVAILNQGEVLSVGGVQELTSRIGNQVEVVWEGTAAMQAIAALGAEIHTGGELARAVIDRSHLDNAIDALRRTRARLVSVTPVRATLEDYFLHELGAAASPQASTANEAVR